MTVVLAHHPSNWLKDCEEDVLRSELNSSDGFNADVYLCGHTHNRDVIHWFNNRKSLTTLVTGLGWPNESGEERTDLHTYSIYVFNLEINSMDIYVRRTRDDESFISDLSIYTNEKNNEKQKIVFPIKRKNNEAFMEISRPKGRFDKAHYMTTELMVSMKKFVLNLSQFCQSLSDCIEKQRNDFFEGIEGINDEEDKELFQLLFSEDNLDTLQNLRQKLRMVFDNNDELLYEGFDSFLQKVCFLLSECFLKEDLLDTEIIRFHFRYYDEQDDRYKKLCASYPTYNREIKMEDHKLSDMIWGDLIKESFHSRRPLIYSADKELCKSHALNQK